MSTAVAKKKRYKRPRSVGALLPIDFALLEILPDEGQMMGFNPIALHIKSIRERPEFKDVSGNQIGGRLKALSFQGLTTSQVIMPVQRGLGWQRTAKGKDLLKRNGKAVGA